MGKLIIFLSILAVSTVSYSGELLEDLLCEAEPSSLTIEDIDLLHRNKNNVNHKYGGHGLGAYYFYQYFVLEKKGFSLEGNQISINFGDKNKVTIPSILKTNTIKSTGIKTFSFDMNQANCESWNTPYLPHHIIDMRCSAKSEGLTVEISYVDETAFSDDQRGSGEVIIYPTDNPKDLLTRNKLTCSFK